MKWGKIIFTLVIGAVFMYIFYAMWKFDAGNGGRQADSVKKIIDKALVQCYALEGVYPAEIDDLEKYGVIINRDVYIYYYDWFVSNIRPDVVVFVKED
jgi:hypothetical protein